MTEEEQVDPAVLANRVKAREGMRRLRSRRKAEREARKALQEPLERPKTAKTSTERSREARKRARERQDAIRAFLDDVVTYAETAMEGGYATASHATAAVTARELLELLDATRVVPLDESLRLAFFLEDVQDDPEGQEEVTRDIERAFESQERQQRRTTTRKDKDGPSSAVLDQVIANLTWAHERLKSDEGAGPSDITAGLVAARRLIAARATPTRQADLRAFATAAQIIAFQSWMDDPDPDETS